MTELSTGELIVEDIAAFIYTGILLSMLIAVSVGVLLFIILEIIIPFHPLL